MDTLREGLGVFGGEDLRVIVEVDEGFAYGEWARRFRAGVVAVCDFLAVRPGCDASCPLIEFLGAVLAGVEDFGAVQAAVNEVGGDVHEARPLDRVGADESDVVAAKETDELGHDEGGMANLDGVADRFALAGFGVGAAFQAVVVLFGEGSCGVGVSREQSEELLERIGFELKVGRELPEDGAEFGAEGEQAGGEKVCQGLLDAAEAKHVGDVTAAFDGEDEVRRSLGGPGGEARGSLERIECSIDLDGGEEGGAIGEFLLVCQTGGIEVAAPGLVGPAGDADAYLSWQDGRPPSSLWMAGTSEAGVWMTKIEAGLQDRASY